MFKQVLKHLPGKHNQKLHAPKKVAPSSVSEAWKIRPQDMGPTYYRGTVPGRTDRITTGDASWDSYLFVADTKEGAAAYGSDIEEVTFLPGSKILVEGTGAFNKLGRWKAGENALEFSSRIAKKAKDRGYDAVHFRMQTTVGTAILNPAAVIRGGHRKLVSEAIAAGKPVPDEIREYYERN